MCENAPFDPTAVKFLTLPEFPGQEEINQLTENRDFYKELFEKEQLISDGLLKRLENVTAQRDELARKLSINPDTYAWNTIN